MKTLIIILIISFFLTGFSSSQTRSNLTFDAGTDITAQTGTDICADTIIFHGTYTITGTICGHSIGIKPIASEIPNSYNLYQNYPNPFNPTTKIKFDIPAVGSGRDLSVQLRIYDILGREAGTLVNEQLKPGTYEVEWDGINYTSGIYFYKLETENFVQTKKFILMK